MNKLKIALVDDHQMVIDGLKLMLNKEESYEVVFEAHNGKDIIQYLKKSELDIILLDLNMPEINGIETSKIIKKENPEQKIIIISMLSDIKLIKKLIKIGINGYLLKNAGQQEILTALKSVSRGQNYFDNRLMELLLESKETQKTKSNYLPSLSRREKEILGLIIKEFTTAEIAQKLFISHGTVETHRRNMISKLGVRNTAGLVSIAYEYNLLQD